MADVTQFFIGPAASGVGGYWTTGDQTLPGGAKTFTGGPWTFTRTAVASSAETIMTWKVSDDSTSNITFKNSTTTDSTFGPHIQMQITGSSLNNLQSYEVQTDSGTAPAITWRAQTIAGAALATRPAFQWNNWTTMIALLSAGGVFKVGGTTSTLYSRLGQKFETNTSADYGGAALNTWSAATVEASVLDFNRSKSATIGTHTIIASGDLLGYIIFRGSDGTAFRDAAGIRGEVDGTPGASDMPGRLVFDTVPDGSATRSERMRITNAGNVGVGKTPTTGIILDVNGQLGLKSYTVATLPSAAVQAGAIVYASDAGGNGPCLAISNGTNWKRCDNTSTTVA